MTLLAEIIRVSTRGATEAEISNELSLSPSQARVYTCFLRSKKLLVLVDTDDYFK
jgi:orotate phosphoribosyltransferase-like protein